MTQYLKALGCLMLIALCTAVGCSGTGTQPASSVPLTGTDWVMVSCDDGSGTLVPLREGTEVTALFNDDGNLGGSAGCNGYGCSYEVNGEQMTCGPVITTLMYCEMPGGTMAQEQAYLAALGNVARYAIDGDLLMLYGEDGGKLVVFSAVA